MHWIYICPPKKYTQRNIYSQCDGLRRCGFWEIIRWWRWSLYDRVSALTKDTSRVFTPAPSCSCSLSVYHGKIQQEVNSLLPKRMPSPESKHAKTLILDFQNCNKFPWFKPSSLWLFVNSSLSSSKVMYIAQMVLDLYSILSKRRNHSMINTKPWASECQ